MTYKPYEYQETALRWVIDHPRCALFLDMGLGKSVITLTAIQQLIDDCDIDSALVVAPKKVAETTWTSEADKWNHLKALKVVKVMGTPTQRKKALATKADVYVVGRDSFVWLASQYGGALPFDMIVIDELTSFKSSKALRFRAMKIATTSAARVVGLTGTPAPNGLVDLWGQMYVIDMGQRLGKSVTRYRDTYFNQHRRNNIVVRCTPKPGADKAIRDKISDICLSMRARDYLALPDLITRTIYVELPTSIRQDYEKFERDKVLHFIDEHKDDDNTLLATSAAALMNKLSQFANGAVYDEQHNVIHIHDEKTDNLAELVEAANAAGSGVIVYYQYRHDIGRIQQALKQYSVRIYDGEKDLRDWNRHEVDVLLAHPASTAFGLNLQEGGHYIVWFGTGWNLELYQQANARLHRQGQSHPVIVYRLVCKDTVDERATAAIDGKKNQQQALLDSLNYLRDKHNINQPINQ